PGPGKRPLLVLKKPVLEATPSPAITAAPPAPQLDRMTVGSPSDRTVDEPAVDTKTPTPAPQPPVNAALTVHPRDLPSEVTGATPPVEASPDTQPILPSLAADEPAPTPKSDPSVPKFGDNLEASISEGSTAGKPKVGAPPPAPVRV